MARSARFRPFLHTALLVAALPLPWASAQSGQTAGDGARERLERHAREELEARGFSGAVLVRRGEELLLRRGFGLADRETQRANTPETVFRIGSVSKQFTAALVLRLAERGLLDLDALAGEYWADCPPAWSEVTVRHLLGHTAGIPNVTDREDYLELCLKPLRPAESLALVADVPLEFAPGTRWSYSNSGYLLLASIAETVGEKPFEVLLEEQIFAPLRLAHTGSEVRTGVPAGMAKPYAQSATGETLPGPPIDMNFPAGGGGLHSTVDDLSRWLGAIDRRELLGAASWEAMLSEGLGNYGLGLMVGEVNGERVAHHGGSINGFESWVALFPERDLQVVVLSNLASESEPRLNAQRAGMELAGLCLDLGAVGAER
jgi:CubicO group peptidase (beta-lactamase class C family)